MKKITIHVREICGDNTYTRDEAKPLYKRISDILVFGDSAVIDFDNREIASESFLDEAIVEHFIHPLVSEAPIRIILKNVSRPDQMLLQRIHDYRKRLDKEQAAKLVKDVETKRNSKHESI